MFWPRYLAELENTQAESALGLSQINPEQPISVNNLFSKASNVFAQATALNAYSAA
ncbi:MAG: hypothetical protein G01um101418_879 [Parcubacteria group bacterium Gr01-1014_18]|nr:MAG: hypothetical protein Greene041636_839 [Parcubacteria group bacterium Greene0416_36]TSC79880.1 MAG: hypothetical protein G01um101418_879 [Parcubacteria group bacterium Gr01-1014_18]TSC98312.1 MAG: hypothetical protein Greene101420_816 [Parcubacteria group bacterium Greene1014_20]TSD06647.1 MAG: hypothetical protein Greene07142_699 [Parcubacteria group bacterium Greene0714_2]